MNFITSNKKVLKFNSFNLKQSDILRNTVILTSGTAFAQLIPILIQPLLRRSFTPDIFGAYSVYLSLLGILIVISSLRYEQAIVLPEEDHEALSLFFLSVFLNLIFNLILFIVILAFKSEILTILNLDERFDIYLFLTPAGIFLFGCYQSINFLLIRKKEFLAISINKFVRRGFEGSCQIAFVFTRISNGLIFGDLIGHIANICSGMMQGLKTGLAFRYLSLNRMMFVLRKYSDFPKYNFIPAFMEACSFMLPVLMINKFFSTQTTGYFDLSKLLLSIPLALIATSLSNVLLQRISEKNRLRLSIKRELKQVLSIVAVIAIVEITIIMFFSEEVFRLFFGPNWELSGRISKILVWSFAFSFITSSFTSIFISLKKIKLFSAWQVIYFAAIITLFFFSHLNFISFIKVYVAIELVCSTIVSLILLFIIARYENEILTLSPVDTK